MPYPSQVNPDTIVASARELIEHEGFDQLSLGRLAESLGVKAPSLYRYFDGKNALLRAVNSATGASLISAVRSAVDSTAGNPEARVMALAKEYRVFAHAHPITYALMYSNLSPDAQSDPQEAELQVLPLQALMAQLSGEANSLAAIRSALALIHGFVMLELTGNFRRGGDLDAAFEQSVQALIYGWKDRSGTL
jgi:AcrR family transcriptional regulator